MKKLIPFAMACALLAGCGSAQTKQHTVVESDLLHHNFVLQSVDGVAVEAK